MSKNLNLNLNVESLRAALPALRKALPSIVGLALVGLFAFTAYELNSLINVQSASTQSTIPPLQKIVFDQKVLSSLQNRSNVNGSVPLNLGTNNPF
jgi:hypothetical protein